MKIVEKPQFLSYLEHPENEIPVFRQVVDGLFTHKKLKKVD